MKTRVKGTSDGRIAERSQVTPEGWHEIRRVCQLDAAQAGARLLADGRFLILDETRWSYLKRALGARELAECEQEDEPEPCDHEWSYRKSFPHDLIVCDLCPEQREADYDYP